MDCYYTFQVKVYSCERENFYYEIISEIAKQKKKSSFELFTLNSTFTPWKNNVFKASFGKFKCLQSYFRSRTKMMTKTYFYIERSFFLSKPDINPRVLRDKHLCPKVIHDARFDTEIYVFEAKY